MYRYSYLVTTGYPHHHAAVTANFLGIQLLLRGFGARLFSFRHCQIQKLIKVGSLNMVKTYLGTELTREKMHTFKARKSGASHLLVETGASYLWNRARKIS